MFSGFYKMFTSPTAGCVETKYNSVSDIEVMTMDREVKKVDQYLGKFTLFVTVASGNAMTAPLLKRLSKMQEEFKKQEIKCVLLSTNENYNEDKGFSHQKSFYEKFNFPIIPNVNFFFFHFFDFL